MSTHPNAILMAVLTPDDLPMKTKRNISEFCGVESEYDLLKICNKEYNIQVMENDYEKSNQIKAEESNIVVFNYITYGYGDKIIWEDVEQQKKELEEWAKLICEKFHCSYKIYISANYW
jgi:hypothetical protein